MNGKNFNSQKKLMWAIVECCIEESINWGQKWNRNSSMTKEWKATIIKLEEAMSQD